MSDFFGTDAQIAVQKMLWADHAKISRSPYLSNGGRILNVLDPDAIGWDQVRSLVEKYQVVGLTMVPLQQTIEKLRKLFGTNVDLPYWQAFLGDAEPVVRTCSALVDQYHLPDGWRLESSESPNDDVIDALRDLNVACGVAPTPSYYLSGDAVPSLTTCVWDENGSLAACAHATMRYHPQSRLAGAVFAGAVSVGPEFRRKGLGVLTNAVLLRDSHSAFGWSRVLEQAKQDNAASCGMIRKCGLVRDADYVTIVVNLSGEYLTR